MSLDTTALGSATADLMQKIEDVYGDDAEILDAIVIAEVSFKDEGDDCTAVEYWCTSPRSVIQAGLLSICHEAEASPSVDDDDE